MTLQERSDIALAFTRVLYVNGQSTDDTLAAADRLSNALGLHTTIIPRWGELQLKATDGTAELLSLAPASPTGVRCIANVVGLVALGPPYGLRAKER